MAQDMVRDEHRRSLGTAALHGLGFLILTALLTVMIVVQQRAAGAYTAEFSATGPEEAGHVVTSLMVADYIAAGLPPPLAFIGDYGLHFPRVVLGLSPPLFYLIEGVWLTLLEPSTPAVLLLPAVLAALLVASAGWAAARRFGPLPGVAVGAVLMALPPLREATLVVGLDLPLALLMLWAGLAYAAFLERPDLRRAMLFGVLAAAAVLTKLTGVALLLLPALAVLLTGRFSLLRRGAFWLPLLPIVVLAGPWTIGTLPMVQAAAQAAPASPAFGTQARDAADGLGGVLALLAAAGVVLVSVGAWRRRAGDLLPAVLAALVLAFVAALLVLARGFGLPPSGAASWLPLYAPLVMLAAAGGLRLVGLATSGWHTLAGLLVALVMLLAAMPGLMTVVSKPALGLDAVAQTFLADTSRPPALLVLAGPDGEGALVAAVAQRDRALRSFVVPARAAFTVPGPGPAAGAPLYETPEELMIGVDRLGVGYIAVADGGDAWLRERLEAAIAAHPERFRSLGSFPRPAGGGEARLFALLPPPAAAP
ncbi:glycosyltransferase family 39 protein [Xanthobacter sp. V2C-8]|uniref:glycosyltransferase family 39 protein n=1 Tax=Xanthobacter albus TaxID=3119929 RepID=UPI00372B563E